MVIVGLYGLVVRPDPDYLDQFYLTFVKWLLCAQELGVRYSVLHTKRL